MRKKILPQEGLKLIACITMLLDHFGYTVVPYLSVPYMEELYYVVRGIGRIAFPIYAFLLAEGMRHTSNPQKYILRLAIGILLSEIPFDLALSGRIAWNYQNVMFTLTLGAIMLWLMQKYQHNIWRFLLIPVCAAVAEILCFDYGMWGILMIAVFASVDKLPLQVLCLAVINALVPTLDVLIFGIPVPIQLFAVFAMVPIVLYSGRKLTRNKAVQWGFYLFYPIHLLTLWIILLLIG